MKKIFNFLKKLTKPCSGSGLSISVKSSAVIIPRAEHIISRKNINQSALKVLYRLHEAGYQAYLVGGSVRDLLLGQHPKDFDVATDALPEDVHRLFKNSYIIGRRFRLVHVRFGQDIIEVVTFRSGEEEGDRAHTQNGMILRDNIYGTLEEDVWRRDFTMNALYYNIADFSVVDYTGGVRDINERCIRVIGEPKHRYREDPARMLRAIRLAAKLGFYIHEDSGKPIYQMASLIQNIPSARLFDKMIKIFNSGKIESTFDLLEKYKLFQFLFPKAYECLTQKENGNFHTFMHHAFVNSDTRIKEGKSLNPAFLFAAILWCPLQLIIEQQQDKHNIFTAVMSASRQILPEQTKIIGIPRRFTLMMQEIWLLQYRFFNFKRKNIFYVFQHPRFRAAYDFLLLREKSGENVGDICEWWTCFQFADEDVRNSMIKAVSVKPKRKRKRK